MSNIELSSRTGTGAIAGWPGIGGIAYSYGYKTSLSLFDTKTGQLYSWSSSFYAQVSINGGPFNISGELSDTGLTYSGGVGSALGMTKGASLSAGVQGTTADPNSMGLSLDAQWSTPGAMAILGFSVTSTYTWDPNAYTPGYAFADAMAQLGNSAFQAGMGRSVSSYDPTAKSLNRQFAYTPQAVASYQLGTLADNAGFDEPRDVSRLQNPQALVNNGQGVGMMAAARAADRVSMPGYSAETRSSTPQSQQ